MVLDHGFDIYEDGGSHSLSVNYVYDKNGNLHSVVLKTFSPYVEMHLGEETFRQLVSKAGFNGNHGWYASVFNQ